MPAARQASSRKRAVVRLPSAQSVPSTAMRGAPTVRIVPSQKWRSVRRAVRRTSRIVTPFLWAAAASAGSSARNSWRPLTTDMPASIASKRSARSPGVTRPPDVATPTMQKSGFQPMASSAAAIEA